MSLGEKCPNAEFFLVHIQFEYRKIRARKNSVLGHFSRCALLLLPFLLLSLLILLLVVVLTLSI